MNRQPGDTEQHRRDARAVRQATGQWAARFAAARGVTVADLDRALAGDTSSPAWPVLHPEEATDGQAA